jgi:hypothetical protein
MNFLELCQDVSRESGTIGGSSQPSTVVAQTGRLLLIVNWTAKAWLNIQDMRSTWRWMRKSFSGETTAGIANYSAAGWSINSFRNWIINPDESDITIYKTALGVSDESRLQYLDWSVFRRRYKIGAQTNNRPIHYTVGPNNNLHFGPAPDAAYTVQGEYYKAAQNLSANADIPEMPEDFHRLIVWDALILLHGHDEGEFARGNAVQNRLVLLDALERDQLPPIKIGLAGPLA